MDEAAASWTFASIPSRTPDLDRPVRMSAEVLKTEPVRPLGFHVPCGRADGVAPSPGRDGDLEFRAIRAREQGVPVWPAQTLWLTGGNHDDVPDTQDGPPPLRNRRGADVRVTSRGHQHGRSRWPRLSSLPNGAANPPKQRRHGLESPNGPSSPSRSWRAQCLLLLPSAIEPAPHLTATEQEATRRGGEVGVRGQARRGFGSSGEIGGSAVRLHR